MSRDEQEPYYEMAREEKRRYDQNNYRIETYRYSYRSREQKNNGNYLWIPFDPLFGVSFSDILRTILRLHKVAFIKALHNCKIIENDISKTCETGRSELLAENNVLVAQIFEQIFKSEVLCCM